MAGMRAFWTARPNDEHRLTEPNRAVVEQGRHAVLMATKGAYWALYESQFSNEPVAA